MGGMTMENILPTGATVVWDAEMFDYGRQLGVCAKVALPGVSEPIRHAVRVLANDPDALLSAHAAMAGWFADRLAGVAA